MIDEIISKLNDMGYKVTYGFIFGSYVYSPHEFEDVDVVVISDDYQKSISFDGYDVQFMSWQYFWDNIDGGDMQLIEAMSYTKNNSYKHLHRLPENNDHVFNIRKVRNTVSGKVSLSFVKSKKKVSVAHSRDMKSAYKSLYHCFRMLNYGIQVGTHGYVKDFAVNDLNVIHSSIKQDFELYFDYPDKMIEIIKQKYKPLLPNHEFRMLCPK